MCIIFNNNAWSNDNEKKKKGITPFPFPYSSPSATGIINWLQFYDSVNYVFWHV